MKTTLELLRERLLKDKEIFPHYNEYINGILYDIDNELLAMEKEQIIEAHLDGQTTWDVTSKTADKYYNETFKSEQDFSCVQFILDNKTSSATKCICGREKWQHTNL